MPQAKLPERFSYPQDARRQVTEALGYMEKAVGAKPAGMWPSEGSVSRETVEILGGEGLSWLATDEGILAKSLGMELRNNSVVTEPKLMYRPYRLAGVAGSPSPAIFFRDRTLSDLIGFTYGSWNTDEAVKDLVGRLEGLADALGHEASDHVVPIILDGENAWEYYPDDGQAFLGKLYHALTISKKISTSTFSDFIQNHEVQGKLDKIYPGSWINSDYAIWIGEDDDNKAWDLLRSARECLDQKQAGLEKLDQEKAAGELLVAEGSDWCWWYGGNFNSENLEDFDQLFRSHISKAYQYMHQEPPEAVHTPIAKAKTFDRLISKPTELITPIIDGISTSYYEWVGSGIYDTKQIGGTMHRSQNLIKTIYYGFDLENLFIRLDLLDAAMDGTIPNFGILLDIAGKKNKIKIPLKNTDMFDNGIKCKCGKIIEIQVPFGCLEVKENESLTFYISIISNSTEIERHPLRDPIMIFIPGKDFLAMNWQV